MPTALAEWTPERPEKPGFYWWMPDGGEPEIVEISSPMRAGTVWFRCGDEMPHNDTESDSDGPLWERSLWWPVRLEHPPVG
jgi:hypothetical protein